MKRERLVKIEIARLSLRREMSTQKKRVEAQEEVDMCPGVKERADLLE